MERSWFLPSLLLFCAIFDGLTAYPVGVNPWGESEQVKQWNSDAYDNGGQWRTNFDYLTATEEPDYSSAQSASAPQWDDVKDYLRAENVLPKTSLSR